MLSFYQRLMFGKFDEIKNGSVRDLSLTQAGILIPLMVLVFYLGIFPSALLDTIEPSVAQYRTLVLQKGNGEPRNPLRTKLVDEPNNNHEVQLLRNATVESQVVVKG